MRKIVSNILISVIFLSFFGCGNSHDPVTKENKRKSSIHAAKALFQSIRTEAAGLFAIDHADTGNNAFLSHEAESIERSLGSAVLDAGLVASYSAKIIEAMLSETTETTTEDGRYITLQQVSGRQWDYNISNMTAQTTWRGHVILPESLNLQNIEEENASLRGTFPLYLLHDSENTNATQQATLDLHLKRKPTEDFLLDIRRLSVAHDDTNMTFSHFTVDANYTADSTQLNFIKVKGTGVHLKIPGYTYDGNMTIPETSYVQNSTLKDNNGYLPSRLLWSGILRDTSTNASLNGTIQLDWIDANSSDVSVVRPETASLKLILNGLLKRPHYQDTNMVMHIEQAAGGTQRHIVASYKNNNLDMSLEGTFDASMHNGNVIISSSNGVTVYIAVANGEIVYNSQASYVEKDGERIGTIEKQNNVPVVRYIDGTFESLQ